MTKSSPPPGAAWDLSELRAGLDAFAASVSVCEPLADVRDEMLVLEDRSLPVRTFRPDGADDAVLVWLHGGGYISGSVDAIDPVCRSLARRLGSTVIAVGYRLAPENPFPAALLDATEALHAIADRRGGQRFALGGDSAGGGLAAAAATLTDVPLQALVLLCPFLDATLSCPSVRERGADQLLTEADLREFVRLYVGADGDPADPRVSPLLGEDLTGLPPLVVVTAGDDPLRDEAERYAARVIEAGGTALLRRWEGMMHGFAGMTATLPQAEEALTWAAESLRGLLDG